MKPFENLVDAQAWVDAFVRWYNEEHRHSGLNWMTPIARHTGQENELLRRRADTYRKARQRYPNAGHAAFAIAHSRRRSR